jgi:hypothetical protein
MVHSLQSLTQSETHNMHSRKNEHSMHTHTRCRLSGERPVGRLPIFRRARVRFAFDDDGRKEIIRLRVSDTGSRVALVVARQQIIFRLLAFKASQGHSLFGDLDERSVWRRALVRSLACSLGAQSCCISLARLHFCAAAAKLWSTHPTRSLQRGHCKMQGCAAGQIR